MGTQDSDLGSPYTTVKQNNKPEFQSTPEFRAGAQHTAVLSRPHFRLHSRYLSLRLSAPTGALGDVICCCWPVRARAPLPTWHAGPRLAPGPPRRPRAMVTVAKPSACELEGARAPPGGAQAASEGPQDLGKHRPRRVRGASGLGLDARPGARR